MSDLTAINGEFELLRSILGERICRLWAATKANALGYRGESRVAEATGISRVPLFAEGNRNWSSWRRPQWKRLNQSTRYTARRAGDRSTEYAGLVGGGS